MSSLEVGKIYEGKVRVMSGGVGNIIVYEESGSIGREGKREKERRRGEVGSVRENWEGRKVK